MPASAYRQIRRISSSASSPLFVDFDKNTAHSTDWQLRMELLCCDCEQLFSKNGENAMARLWANDEAFPLLEKLNACASACVFKDRTYYPVEKIESGVLNTLQYFGASVIWRSHFWDHGKNPSHSGSLGLHYERVFREYLLGRHKSMPGVKVLVIINTNDALNGYFSLPYHGRTGSVFFHKFNVLGVYFNFSIGARLPAGISAPFKKFETDCLIMSADMAEAPQIQDLGARSLRVEMRGLRVD